MKRSALFTLIVVMISVFFSCSKDEKLSTNTLIGKWELRSLDNGEAGTKQYFEPGNGNILEFRTEDYRIIENNKTTKQGRYSIEKKVSSVYNTEGSYIIYEGEENGLLQLYSIEKDKLSITIDVMDGSTYTYKRID